jgi:hypothetical protein
VPLNSVAAKSLAAIGIDHFGHLDDVSKLKPAIQTATEAHTPYHIWPKLLNQLPCYLSSNPGTGTVRGADHFTLFTFSHAREPYGQSRVFGILQPLYKGL